MMTLTFTGTWGFVALGNVIGLISFGLGLVMGLGGGLGVYRDAKMRKGYFTL